MGVVAGGVYVACYHCIALPPTPHLTFFTALPAPPCPSLPRPALPHLLPLQHFEAANLDPSNNQWNKVGCW